MSKNKDSNKKESAVPAVQKPKKRFFNVEKRFGYTLHEMWRYKMSYALIAPFFILFITFTLLPLLASTALCFTYWNIFEDPVFNGLDNYEFEDVCVYLAYVKNWYENNDEPNQCPSCIDEFFDCEMADDDLREYYESLGNEIFNLFEELNEKCED